MRSIYSFLAIACMTFSVQAISPLSIKGNKFFNAEGQQVYFKGVAYQRSPEDPLVNTTQCQLDAALMQTLGANTIRSYHVDPTGDHDGCMQAFSDAGIYLFLDVDTFTTMIVETDPQWTTASFANFTKVIDAFDKYDNLAGFFISNEGVNTSNGTAAAPYIKAATRDTKAYMKAKGGRYIPMGYSAADISSIRPMFQDYLACGPVEDAIDFFAVNIYEWCGSATFQSSGYADRVAEFQGYPIPAFFSETGCNVVEPRTFTDMVAIYSSNMTGVLSGAIVYEWTEEANNYGLIRYPGNTIQDGVQVAVGSPVPIQPDFSNLQSQWAAASPSSISAAAYTPATTTFPCPGTTSGWTIDGNAPLPGPPTTLTPPPPSTFNSMSLPPLPTQGTNTGVSSSTETGAVSRTSTNTAGGSQGTGTSATGTASAASGSSSSSKSTASKRLTGDSFVAFVAFTIACVAFGCIV